MLSKDKKKKLRELLAKLDPSEKDALLAQGLEEEIKSVADQLGNIKDSSGSIKEIQDNIDQFKIDLLGKLENLPTTSDLEGVKKKYLEQIDVVKKEFTLLVSNIETDVLGLNSEVSSNKEESDKALKEIKDKLQTWYVELSSKRGGAPNQLIAVNGTVATTRYADIDFVAPGAVVSNNNTTKRTTIDLTLAGGVDSIIAGTNISISPSNGKGDVTINNTLVAPTPFLTQDTERNILATTATLGKAALATDLTQMMVGDGTNWWINSSYFAKDLQAQDLGIVQGSNRSGYGTFYITDKTISNSAIGGNVTTTTGGIRYNATGLNSNPSLQAYFNSVWNNIVAGFNFQEVNFVLEHTPVGGLFRIAVFSGNSDLLGLNGLPLVQGYRVSLGAFPIQPQLNGGTF